MGKKRKIISKPQKFGRKHVNHPLLKTTTQSEELAIDLKPAPVAEEPKPEPKPELKPQSKPAPKKADVKKEEPRKRKKRQSIVTKKTKPTSDQAI